MPAEPARTRLPALAPFRLDLTTAVLRRLSSNVVDRCDERGVYRRAFDEDGKRFVMSAVQSAPAEIEIEISGERPNAAHGAKLATRILGLDRDLRAFYAAARKVEWLHPLAKRMRGMKPPRYPTLWEACVNAIVFQQVSIHAAAAILGRTIELLAEPLAHAGETLYAFPGPARFLAAGDGQLRAAGLSFNKVATLRRVAEALLAGLLDEPMLEARSTPAASEILCAIKGIGPWTAAVILLRGLGRLDLFPENDSGAARSLAAATGGRTVDVEAALGTLGAWRGLLYYHLLLARLEARGEISH